MRARKFASTILSLALANGVAVATPLTENEAAGIDANSQRSLQDVMEQRAALEVAGGPRVPDGSQVSTDHWAFQAISNPEPPGSGNPTAWGDELSDNPIDAFVAAALREQGLEPSPPASPPALLRRLYLDLVGLQPPEETLLQFLSLGAEQQQVMYEQIVDQLLASPHFGERWAIYWLDAARYADSGGYAHDNPRTAWPYRDYVIDSFNEDLPFDQFVIEQLAGDLLQPPLELAAPEKPPEVSREIIASGFHRNTMTNTEGGIDEEEFRVESVKDRVNTTAKVFMGLTLECAQCHNHAYDPLTQQEYYRFYAFFNDAEETTFQTTTSYGPIELMTFQPRDEPREAFIQTRGDFNNVGATVYPGTPAVLPPLTTAGRASRLDLAYWLVSPEHPLLKRVTVNRIWQALFGLGIVATEDDFGTRGDPPTHPELLDWLSQQFAADGWSVKSLIRRIVTSKTYQQSANLRQDIDDPHNRLLARQRRLRLDAEIIRDVTLQAAGLLNLEVGGPSVYPPIPSGVIDSGRNAREWPQSSTEERHRRGLYTFLYRTVPYPSLFVFDAPDAVVSVTRRPRSNTFLQALTLLNDSTFVEAAFALGLELAEATALTDQERLQLAYHRTLGRDPNPDELEVMLTLLDEERDEPSKPSQLLWARDPSDVREAAAWSTIARVLFNLDEFITRE